MLHHQSLYFCMFVLFYIGSISLRFRLGLHRRIIMCKLIQEVTFYGWTVLDVKSAPRKVTLEYVFFFFCFSSMPYPISLVYIFNSELRSCYYYFCQISLALYNPQASSTAKKINCDQEICVTTLSGPNDECRVGMYCSYQVTYGDGSSTMGYFVRDTIQLDRASGDLQTTFMNGSIAFGQVCCFSPSAWTIFMNDMIIYLFSYILYYPLSKIGADPNNQGSWVHQNKH